LEDLISSEAADEWKAEALRLDVLKAGEAAATAKGKIFKVVKGRSWVQRAVARSKRPAE